MLFKPNYCNITLFILTMGLMQFTSNFAANYPNQSTKLLQAKNNWVDEKEKNKYSQLISAVFFGGTIFGAMFAGQIIVIGRRLTCLLLCAIGIIGASITLISAENITTIIIGRILMGYSAGLAGVAVNRYIEEYVPLSIYGSVSAFNLFLG